MPIVLAVLFSLLFVANAKAESKQFYHHTLNDFWFVKGSENLCIAGAHLDEGQKIHITRDLTSGEFYIWLQHPDWEFNDSETYPRARLNFYTMNLRNPKKGFTFVDGGELPWVFNDKNIVRFRDLNIESVSKVIWKSNALKIIMPEKFANIGVGMPGRDIITRLSECVKAYKSDDKIPDISGNPAAKPNLAKEKGRI